MSSRLLDEINSELDELSDMYKLIDDAIDEEAPFSIREGKIFKSGYNEEIDRLRDILTNGGLDERKVCLTCSKCTSLMRAMSCTGCPIRDRDPYLDIYQKVFAK